MIHLLKGNRVYRSYFGGKNLDKFFNVEDPKVSQFPEEWIASLTKAINPGRERIEEGYSLCLDGKKLKDVINESPIECLGEENYSKYGNKAPFLLKLLDSAERLFIQCHPTTEFAKRHFNSQFGKTESWYILEAEKDAHVYLGFKEGITKEQMIDCFQKQDIEGMLSMMHKHPVKSGDTIFVDGGVPHAIGAGCFLIELQEPTDLMVIPERKSASGITLTDEKMHGGLGFERMFDVFDYTGYSYTETREKYIRNIKTTPNELVTLIGEEWTDKFKMQIVELDGEINFDPNDKCCVAVILEGNCVMENSQQLLRLNKGDELFIAANTPPLFIKGKAKIILCR